MIEYPPDSLHNRLILGFVIMILDNPQSKNLHKSYKTVLNINERLVLSPHDLIRFVNLSNKPTSNVVDVILLS